MYKLRYQILLLVFLFNGFNTIAAGEFSYVFIQGDKSTPFYVKLEDQMMPRYGRNYNLIPQLAPGVINIQILFQQNAHPPQNFTILVPEAGYRGFQLVNSGGNFALYDIHQQLYIKAGNSIADDRVPAANTADVFASKGNQVDVKQTYEQPAAVAVEKEGLKFLPDLVIENRNRPQVSQPVQAPQSQIASASNGYSESYPYNSNEPTVPIEEIERTPRNTYGTPATTPIKSSRPILVANSDCPSPIDDGTFEDIYRKLNDKQEKLKLKYLLTNMDACFTTTQSRILAESLSNDPERFTFLKKVYPRVTDQHNFPVLESLLTTNEWRSYFKLILPE